jgi:hypothetical protein
MYNYIWKTTLKKNADKKECSIEQMIEIVI